jgi:hypothetical protein
MAVFTVKSTATLTITERNLALAASESGPLRGVQASKEFCRQLYADVLELTGVTASFEVSCGGAKLTCVIAEDDTETLATMEKIGERFGKAWKLEEQSLPSTIRRVCPPREI